MEDEIMVSISCITYNHEKYLADAIESFLMQKTTFKFEILIHDDASTDATAQIILKYEKLYPDIIKPIYQTENHYSKNIEISSIYQYPRARGRYIALCEGDDYWTDPSKLQKQVDYLESHPECSLCFHNAEVVDARTSKKTGKLHVPWASNNRKYFYSKNTIYQAGELALLDFIPTASLIFPKHLVLDFINNPPDWFMNAIVGDAPLRLVLASHGYAYYIDEAMSIYRVDVEGSSTERAKLINKDSNELVRRLNKHIEIIDGFDKYSKYKYTDQLDEAKKVWEVSKLRTLGKIKVLKNQRYKSYYKELSNRERTVNYLLLHFPIIYKKIVNIKKALTN